MQNREREGLHIQEIVRSHKVKVTESREIVEKTFADHLSDFYGSKLPVNPDEICKFVLDCPTRTLTHSQWQELEAEVTSGLGTIAKRESTETKWIAGGALR